MDSAVRYRRTEDTGGRQEYEWDGFNRRSPRMKSNRRLAISWNDCPSSETVRITGNGL
jgi:hypothetical protein